jgi:tetratricopeptide (TPR) repeat protein
MLFMLAALVVVASIAGLPASYFSGKAESQAAQMLGGALKLLSRPVQASTAPVDPDAEDETPFPNQRAKDEAVAQELSRLRSAHPKTRAAVTAALPLGEAYYRVAQYEPALSAFEDFLKAVPKTDPLRAEALEGEGYVFEAKHQLEQALLTYDQLANVTKGEFMTGMGLYHRARILAEQGKQEEAAKALVELKSTYPTSAAGRMAGERISLLERQGVKIPPPPAKPAPDAG